jgi:hypothetical protein
MVWLIINSSEVAKEISPSNDNIAHFAVMNSILQVIKTQDSSWPHDEAGELSVQNHHLINMFKNSYQSGKHLELYDQSNLSSLIIQAKSFGRCAPLRRRSMRNHQKGM